MEIAVQPGKYIVAVSGGVDSVALLDALTKLPDLHLVVAHFDHGIRDDSAADATFVESLAAHYGLPYVSRRVELGAEASEATAREARYTFLFDQVKRQGAQSIITAHHQDDVIETAILNLHRGTGRLGLSSLRSSARILRPLLAYPKQQILAYAQQAGLQWHEDSTNSNEQYMRNYIRHNVMPKFSDVQKQQLITITNHIASINDELDAALRAMVVKAQQDTSLADNELPRLWFCSLPHDVSKEVMAHWLRQQQLTDFDRNGIERLVVACKTRRPGKRFDVLHKRTIALTAHTLALD